MSTRTKWLIKTLLKTPFSYPEDYLFFFFCRKKGNHQNISLYFDNVTPKTFSIFWTLSSHLTPMPVSRDVFKYPNVHQLMLMVDICGFCLTLFLASSAPTFYYQHSIMAVRPVDKCVAQTKPVRNRSYIFLWWSGDSVLFFWTHRWILRMLLSPEPFVPLRSPSAWGGCMQ